MTRFLARHEGLDQFECCHQNNCYQGDWVAQAACSIAWTIIYAECPLHSPVIQKLHWAEVIDQSLCGICVINFELSELLHLWQSRWILSVTAANEYWVHNSYRTTGAPFNMLTVYPILLSGHHSHIPQKCHAVNTVICQAAWWHAFSFELVKTHWVCFDYRENCWEQLAQWVLSHAM